MASTTRTASHAGSWYSDDEGTLSEQLDRWLDDVPDAHACIGPLSADLGEQASFPTPSARIIIAPHAGYSYSGPAAAWAYRALDWSKAKRVFVLGPSHHAYLPNCALSACSTYKTPFGDLRLDGATIDELKSTGKFGSMTKSVDEAEHSIEMHLPYIHKMLLRTFSDYAPESAFPPLIPILVGNTSPEAERSYGRLLAPYLSDPTSVFVISSDFAHWGSRFRYTYYEPANGPPVDLRGSDRPSAPPIYESIAAVDLRCVAAVEKGDPEGFWGVLEETGNTVCGRHPIGVILCAVEEVKKGSMPQSAGKFKFVRYERSSDCVVARDSSVSYCSGFAVI